MLLLLTPWQLSTFIYAGKTCNFPSSLTRMEFMNSSTLSECEVAETNHSRFFYLTICSLLTSIKTMYHVHIGTIYLCERQYVKMVWVDSVSIFKCSSLEQKMACDTRNL